MTDEELVKMARLAQRDDRMSTGALYGDLADRIEQLINLNEALVELLEAARADAKEAEAYAEELEKENTRLSGLMSERGQMLRRYDQMVVDGAKREEAWKAKLAKAVEALQAFKAFDDMPARDKRPDVFEVSVRRKLLSTLAEIEGEKG